MAIAACLKQTNISIEDIDYITISKDPSVNVIKKIKHTLFKSRNFRAVFDRIMQANKVSSVKSILANEFGISENKIKAKIYNIEHHRSHMASAFFASPFDEAAVLSIDGFGKFCYKQIKKCYK